MTPSFSISPCHLCVQPFLWSRKQTVCFSHRGTDF